MTNQDPDTLDGGSEAQEQGTARNGNLLHTIHRRLTGTYRYIIPAGLVLGIGAAVLAYQSVPNEYESKGLIQASPTSQRVIYATEFNEELPMFNAWVDAQVGQIMSPRVLDLAMKNQHWVQRGDKSSRIEFFENLNVHRIQRGVLINVGYTHEQPTVAQAAVQALIESYQEVHVDQANRVSNWTVEELQAHLSSLAQQSRDMRNRIAEISGPLSPSAMKDLYNARFSEQVDLDAMITTSKLELAAVEAELVLEEGKTPDEPIEGDAGETVAGSDDTATEEAEQDGPIVRTAEEFAELDDTIQGLLESRDEQAAILAQMISDYGENYLQAKQVRQAIRTLDRQIDRRTDELNGIVAKRWAEDGGSDLASLGGTEEVTKEGLARALQSRIDSLSKLRDEVKQQAESLNFDITQIDDILNEQAVLVDQKERAEQRLRSLQLERGNQGRISVISEGDIPQAPSNSGKRRQVAALAGLAGSGAPLALVFLFNTLRGRIDHFDDAKASLGKDAFLGILPQLPEDLGDPQQALVASLSVHEIRSMLHCTNRSEDAHSYMITSPSAGAGKTTLALALGLSYAGTGMRTLLIDFDTVGAGLSSRIRRIVRSRLGKLLVEQGIVEESQLHQAVSIAERDRRRLGEVLVELGHITEGQLAEALNAQANQNYGLREAVATDDIESCVTETGVPNLYALPVGETNVGDVGTFSAKHIRNLLKQAHKHFDLVLIDTGPILGSLEAAMLAKEVDATVLVIPAGDQQRNVNMAVERLNQSQARLAGLIFNRAKDKDVVRFSSSASQRSRMNNELEDVEIPSNGVEVTTEYGPIARATAAYMPRKSDIEA